MSERLAELLRQIDADAADAVESGNSDAFVTAHSNLPFGAIDLINREVPVGEGSVWHEAPWLFDFQIVTSWLGDEEDEARASNDIHAEQQAREQSLQAAAEWLAAAKRGLGDRVEWCRVWKDRLRNTT
jgi:hypothetical protein